MTLLYECGPIQFTFYVDILFGCLRLLESIDGITDEYLGEVIMFRGAAAIQQNHQGENEKGSRFINSPITFCRPMEKCNLILADYTFHSWIITRKYCILSSRR